MTHLQKSLLKVKTAAFSAIMLLACAGGTACANDRVSEAENLVKALITELEQTSSQADMTDKDHRQVLDKLVDVYFDVDAITRFSVGQYWRVASDSEKSEYTKLFRLVFLNQANEQFHKLRDLGLSTCGTAHLPDSERLTGIISYTQIFQSLKPHASTDQQKTLLWHRHQSRHQPTYQGPAYDPYLSYRPVNWSVQAQLSRL